MSQATSMNTAPDVEGTSNASRKEVLLAVTGERSKPL